MIPMVKKRGVTRAVKIKERNRDIEVVLVVRAPLMPPVVKLNIKMTETGGPTNGIRSMRMELDHTE